MIILQVQTRINTPNKNKNKITNNKIIKICLLPHLLLI